MTLLREREEQIVSSQSSSTYSWEWFLGLVGAFAGMLGLWMRYGPDEGVLNLFGWSWNISDISSAWPFSFLVGGFVAMTGAFGLLGSRLTKSGLVAQATAATIAGLLTLAAAISFFLLWIA